MSRTSNDKIEDLSWIFHDFKSLLYQRKTKQRDLTKKTEKKQARLPGAFKPGS